MSCSLSGGFARVLVAFAYETRQPPKACPKTFLRHSKKNNLSRQWDAKNVFPCEDFLRILEGVFNFPDLPHTLQTSCDFKDFLHFQILLSIFKPQTLKTFKSPGSQETPPTFQPTSTTTKPPSNSPTKRLLKPSSNFLPIKFSTSLNSTLFHFSLHLLKQLLVIVAQQRPFSQQKLQHNDHFSALLNFPYHKSKNSSRRRRERKLHLLCTEKERKKDKSFHAEYIFLQIHSNL
jgi:hypothetical protein